MKNMWKLRKNRRAKEFEAIETEREVLPIFRELHGKYETLDTVDTFGQSEDDQFNGLLAMIKGMKTYDMWHG